VGVVHRVSETGRVQCGAGRYPEHPENYTQDVTKVTCKSCLRWIEYYEKKKTAKNGRS
jgi:hypothetical protein